MDNWFNSTHLFNAIQWFFFTLQHYTKNILNWWLLFLHKLSRFLFHSMQNLCSHFLSLRILQLTPFLKWYKQNYYTFACEQHDYLKKTIPSILIIQTMIPISLTMQDEINHTEVETFLSYSFINLVHLWIIWQWLIQGCPSFLFQLYPQQNPHPCIAGIYHKTNSLLSHYHRNMSKMNVLSVLSLSLNLTIKATPSQSPDIPSQ